MHFKSSKNNGKLYFLSETFQCICYFKSRVYFILNIYLMEIMPKKCI